MADEITVTGYAESVEFLDNFKNTLDTRIGAFLRKIAETAVYFAKNNIQMNQSIMTGSLLASIRILNEDPGGKWVEVGSDEFYAAIIEYGRGEVRPISAKVLHWVDPTTGEDVFAAYSGPVDPAPFMEPAVYQSVRGARDIFVTDENRAIQEMVNDAF